MNRKRVLVAPEQEFQSRRRLFVLLSELYPVDFEAWQPGTAAPFGGAILWEGCAEEKQVLALAGMDCFVVAQSQNPRVAIEKSSVKFGMAAALESYFRGQTMIDECAGWFSAVPLREGDDVICAIEAQPYWVMRKSGGIEASLVALAPEEFGERQTVYDHFNRRRWLRLLPLLHFLKRLTRDRDWDAAPIRACLMFDDPNLHWPTYGFIDLRKLARHAREFNYHVTSAMVPLDSWFVNGGVAALFREHRQHISLCMHGNDHAYRELGSPLSGDEFTRMLAQALRRIEGFERKSGVPVARIMVPPYGAFQENAASPMLNLGYEAVCISRASLTAWNKNKNWAASFGYPIAEFLGNGLPAIPRHVMAPGHEGAYRLAAFLNQPIIPHGHHQDCANGYDLLASVAGSINSLGRVVWSDMSALSRTNFLTRQTGGTLTIRMLARRITLPVNEGVKEIIVERPWISGESTTEPLVCRAGEQTHFSSMSGRHSEVIPWPRKEAKVDFISPALHAINPASVPAPGFQFWPAARRVLSEARDRMIPLRPGRKSAASANGAPSGHK